MHGGGDFEEDWTDEVVVHFADIFDCYGVLVEWKNEGWRGNYCRHILEERSWRADIGS